MCFLRCRVCFPERDHEGLPAVGFSVRNYYKVSVWVIPGGEGWGAYKCQNNKSFILRCQHRIKHPRFPLGTYWIPIEWFFLVWLCVCGVARLEVSANHSPLWRWRGRRVTGTSFCTERPPTSSLILRSTFHVCPRYLLVMNSEPLWGLARKTGCHVHHLPSRPWLPPHCWTTNVLSSASRKVLTSLHLPPHLPAILFAVRYLYAYSVLLMGVSERSGNHLCSHECLEPLICSHALQIFQDICRLDFFYNCFLGMGIPLSPRLGHNWAEMYHR